MTTTEIRYRRTWCYVNDQAGYTKKEPEAVFGFTLEELEALEAWTPRNDGFHREIVEAMNELERLNPIHQE